MTEAQDHSGIETMVGGDADRARRLRATLAVVARRTEDENLRRVVADVLAGRANVRTALLHPGMMSMAQTNLSNLEEGLDRLSPEERDDVMSRVGEERTSEEDIDALREPTPSSDGRRAPGGGGPAPEPPRSGGTW